MDARVLRCLVAVAVLAVAPAGRAEMVERTSQGCELPAADEDPLANRAGILAQYERLPQACLQQIFHACSAASSRGLLDFGSAAVCSFSYEALLRQHFGGSFRALIAWWRAQQDEALQ